MVSSERFTLALRQMDGTQWRLFERLATVFLSTEYPALRPVADPTGDGGLDALLFETEDDLSTAIQFSVRSDWSAKIHQTCRRLKESNPTTKILVFVTNQEMGSDVAALRKSVRERHNIYLDPRDCAWLVSQRNASAANSAEAEELAQNIVDPLLNSASLLQKQAQALNDLEAKAAFVHLGLQWEDEKQDKGITKVCFEAIVRSVLRDTTSEERLGRGAIYKSIQQLLPGHPKMMLNVQVDDALRRLDKMFVRHWRKSDEFCLTWEERTRLRDRVASLSLLDATLQTELTAALQISVAESDEASSPEQVEGAVRIARSVLERIFLERGEAFAAAVARGRNDDVRYNDIEAVVDKVVATLGVTLAIPVELLASTIQGLLLEPPDDVRAYLRGLSDTYTLFAFLKETPDVQSAIVKIFSDGDIWLDTSVVLPILAEDLLDPGARNHTSLLHASSEAGLGLYVTDGVIEEVSAHIRKCIAYSKAISSGQVAYGDPPFLFSVYKMSGRDVANFGSWLDNFCGSDAPNDLLDYFEEEHSILSSNLKEYTAKADLSIRSAVAEVWHDKRDKKDQRLVALGLDPMDVSTRNRLIDHDVENYVGVMMRRAENGENRSTFGYRSWLLTLDRTAFRVHQQIKGQLSGPIGPSPAISPDFMINYLAIGPIRSKISKSSGDMLPLMLNMHALDAVPADLISLADDLRSDLSGLPPRVIRRKIKETLEDARRLLGPTAIAGEVGLTDDIKRRLRQQAQSA